MKICSRCNEYRVIDDFALNRAKSDGRQAWCKSCMKEANASLYRQGYKVVQNRHNRKNRKRYVGEFLETMRSELVKGCSRCDENDPACLDFHHRDPSLKEMAVREAVKRGWSKDRIMAEVAKCDILCSNCHRKHHYYGDVLPV